MAGAGAAVGTAGKHLFAWALGVGAVVAPWVVLDQVPIEVNDWASIYVAGAVGGLALEMLLGRGRLELPSPSRPTAAEDEKDARHPFGPIFDLGFLARVSSSGIAAVALLLVYYALTGEAETADEFNALANDPATFGWAVFLGASSPAVWTAAQRMVEARIAVAEANHTAEVERVRAVQAENDNALLVDANSSLTSTISTAAAELRAGGVAVEAGPEVAVGPEVGAEGLAVTVPPVVDAGEVLEDIEEVVGEAAAAEPGEVDVKALSEALFERLPATVAGLTGPPTVAVEAAVVPDTPSARALQILEEGLGSA